MASRPKGYGLTAEVCRKIEAKYNSQHEEEAMRWMAEVLGESTEEWNWSGGMKQTREVLKDGTILCRVMNALQPSSIKKINDSKMAFKMMENISNFLLAAERYGCKNEDLFQSVDLYEGQNVVQVINGICALGRMARKNGFSGPVFGPKESAQNVRDFSAEVLRAGESVIGLQAGSNKGASQAGMMMGKTRHILD